jgi:adenine-specific DNA-methyltransferase
MPKGKQGSGGRNGARRSGASKEVVALKHEQASRKNIPTAEYQSLVQRVAENPVQVTYERRNKDLDPQLVWRGKDQQDWSDLVVNMPPLYIQEKVHPKALIDDLLRQTREDRHELGQIEADLFSDFNGIPQGVDKTEFYRHDQNWSNRLILGDSLQVMASLAEREGLRGKVQCIYIDPPYGIKFNSNFQWSTTSRDVKDGNAGHITREPEQVKAFRDTWRDGVHSYLAYLRDRFTVARELLTESGSIFVQIGDENVHRVRAILDEVLGERNFISLIQFRKTAFQATEFLANTCDFILWYSKNKVECKVRQLQYPRPVEMIESGFNQVELTDRTIMSASQALNLGFSDFKRFQASNLSSQGASEAGSQSFTWRDHVYEIGSNKHWKTHVIGLRRLRSADRLFGAGKTLTFKRYADDFPVAPFTNMWTDTIQSTFAVQNIYVVQTNTKVVERCILMATDPGDLVLDPTCGSGTTATVAEQWGRRWITIDTSRVALALARARIMGARYPFYLLADSRDGQLKEGEVTRTVPSSQPVHGNIRHGFVYERVPHITLKSIANNSEIDVIWEKWQQTLEPLREKLNSTLEKSWKEWEIPRNADETWNTAAKDLHAKWWIARISRQTEIDASIAAKADFELLYDKPYTDNKKVRVAGPFTVESLSPHRMLAVDEHDELIHTLSESAAEYEATQSFPQMILENLRSAGVQQAHKDGRITFTSLAPWPGEFIAAEGKYIEGSNGSLTAKRAAIFIGSEFGTVARADLVAAAREAGDANFDVLIACAFNYEAHATEFTKLGHIPVLKARMNADLHMSDDLKITGKGNLFVIFGEPDIELVYETGNHLRVRIKGVDVFDPATGEVRSDGPDGIACWFIDTDYNEESFFVRHAYFLGANDPYGSLKTTLRAEINEEAWESLHSDTSRPFDKPKSGRIAVKVINHLGDEVMKVFRV